MASDGANVLNQVVKQALTSSKLSSCQLSLVTVVKAKLKNNSRRVNFRERLEVVATVTLDRVGSTLGTLTVCSCSVMTGTE